MSDRNVTLIVEAANKAAAQAIAVANGDGPSTFAVALSTSPTETSNANATHWGYSGWLPQAEIEAFETSVDPMVNVSSNENTTFFDTIASRVPQLYLVQEAV